jgi:hypothetical protein
MKDLLLHRVRWPAHIPVSAGVLRRRADTSLDTSVLFPAGSWPSTRTYIASVKRRKDKVKDGGPEFLEMCISSPAHLTRVVGRIEETNMSGTEAEGPEGTIRACQSLVPKLVVPEVGRMMLLTLPLRSHCVLDAPSS